MFNIVLVEPEIPQNTGNIARTCAATGCKLHIVKPMGFTIDDKKLKRAGLDYWHLLGVQYYENIEDFLDLAEEPKQDDGILEVILKLPNDYKDAVYLYYYEGYTTVEIARHLNCPEATVRSRLMRARNKLQSMMGGGAK